MNPIETHFGVLGRATYAAATTPPTPPAASASTATCASVIASAGPRRIRSRAYAPLGRSSWNGPQSRCWKLIAAIAIITSPNATTIALSARIGTV